MGCGNSVAAIIPAETSLTESSRRWRKQMTENEALNVYAAEGTVSRDNYDRSRLELRALLDYPIARQFLMTHAKTISSQACRAIDAWFDISVFNSMPDNESKCVMGKTIFTKYVERATGISDMELDIIVAKLDDGNCEAGLFDEPMSHFFGIIYDQIFVQFKDCAQYKLMCIALRKKYNNVRRSDFEYHHILGEGGFGVVCEVVKKSTGMKYAMKVQTKVGLCAMFSESPGHANFEKQAFASCKHPFIVELYYAFQSSTMVMLVMSLGTGRDLNQVLKSCGPLSFDQVLFYSAEITSAISYLHFKSLIYRDLKPGNVLLNADGHIQLVDFGAVCDVKGKTLGVCKDTEHMVPVFQQQFQHMDTRPLTQYWSAVSANATSFNSPDEVTEIQGFGTTRSQKSMSFSYSEPLDGERDANSVSLSESMNTENLMIIPCDGEVTHITALNAKSFNANSSMLNSPSYVANVFDNSSVNGVDIPAIPIDSPVLSQRARSLVGTFGYMAPEMVLMMLERSGVEVTGYTKAVDWWSLGVTMYKLLVGRYPFNTEFDVARSTDGTLTASRLGLERYGALTEEVDFEPLLAKPILIDCLSKLLVLDDVKRLGYGVNGSNAVSSHEYFASIDWIKLERKEIAPPALPFSPTCRSPTSKYKVKKYAGLSSMLLDAGKSDWISVKCKTPMKELPADLQSEFEMWDYTSPTAVMLELGSVR